MTKSAHLLDDAVALVVLRWGQSNARPWGTRSEGFGQAPHLDLTENGTDLAITSVSNVAIGSRTVTLSTPLPAADAYKWIGAEIRFGTKEVPIAGFGTVTAQTLDGDNLTTALTVTLTYAAGSVNPVVGYLCFSDDRWKSYANVRVLTPYQPESAIAYPTHAPRAPGTGYTVPASVTTHEKFALMLPFTFLEGVGSHGMCATTDSYTSPQAHVVNPTAGDITASMWRFTNAVPAIDIFVGGHLWVAWTTNAGDKRISWSTVTTNPSTTTLTLAGWLGDGMPPSTATIDDWEAWVPHYNNSPYAKLHGFRYPSNDMMPFPRSTSAKAIHNTARDITAYGYEERFGALLEEGWRLSSMLGRPVDFVHLGVNSSSQHPRNTWNSFGLQGVCGWWEPDKYLDWTPSNSDGNYARLRTMAVEMMPTALEAVGDTREGRYIALVGAQGEADALTAVGRETYRYTLPAFYQQLREDLAELSYFNGTRAKLPVVHQKILHIPYELVGTFLYYGVTVGPFSGDEDGLVNTAIEEFVARDGFALTYEVDDSPTLLIDPLHFNGVGEAMNGKSGAEALFRVINLAMAQSHDDNAVDICNAALSHIGEFASITSIDTTVDQSEQAALCAQFYKSARDEVLEEHPWAFTTKHMTLVEITKDSDREEWGFAYAVPANMVRPLAVLPPGQTSDYSTPAGLLLPDSAVSGSKFALERDSYGQPVIYSNTDEAVLKFQVAIDSVVDLPQNFKAAVALKLAAKLAGPTIKGAEGAAMSLRMEQLYERVLGKAATIDTAARPDKPPHQPSWMSARG